MREFDATELQNTAATLSAVGSEVRVLVALGINPHSQRLLQTAARLASGLGGQLLAIHIEPPGKPARLYHANLDWHLDQARKLGALVEIVQGSDIATALVSYAQRQRVTHLVMGQSDISRWREITRGSITNRILRLISQQRAHIDLYIVTLSGRD